VVTAWEIPYPIVGFAPAVVDAELGRPTEEDARRAAFDAAARAEEAGVEARPVVVRALPIQGICDAAEKFAPRFLVIGSHGWGPMKRALFGSVSTGVLHHATCPVLVVRGTEVASSNGHAPAEKAHA
jgi:nucleotide-binding universal stress UspA family protein